MGNSYVPKSYSETGDLFAAVMVYAPDMSSFRMTIDEALEKLILGIDSVLRKPKNPAAQDLLSEIRQDVILIKTKFQDAENPVASEVLRKQLQSIYYDKYRTVAGLLKKGIQIDALGPDDAY